MRITKWDLTAFSAGFIFRRLIHTILSSVSPGDLITAAMWNALANATPTGAVIPYAGSSAPEGWLLCYGQAVSRTTYAGLFAIIGTTYGAGDGSTTFNVPDLRGRVALGKDNMGGSSANRVTATEADNLGQGSGAETHTLAASEIPAHSHTIRWYLAGVSGSALTSTGITNGGLTNYVDKDDYGIISLNNTGGGGAHNNVQPYLTLNQIIKT